MVFEIQEPKTTQLKAFLYSKNSNELCTFAVFGLIDLSGQYRKFLQFCHFEGVICGYTGGPLLTRFFETLKKQPCKRRSDLVLNGQMRVPK